MFFLFALFYIRQSTKWFFKYHVGSVAFGSGIITLIWLIQMVLSVVAVRILFIFDNFFIKIAETTKEIWK